MQIIKKLNSEENELLLVNDIFETMNVSDVYYSGQKTGEEAAGDYSIYNQYASADHDCIKDFVNTLNASQDEEDYLVSILEISGDELLIPDSYDESYTDIITSIDEAKAHEFILNWEKENAIYEKCTAHTYWDGHNFKTITVQVENGEPTHEICEGEEFEKMIAEYETAEKVKDVTGGEIWKSENFYYNKSFWQGHFEIAEVENIEDYEMRTGY